MVTKKEFLNVVGRFTYCWGHSFHIETDIGNFEWSDPDYQGDNTIKSAPPYKEFLKKIGVPHGRDKGQHAIKDYCGEDFTLINDA